MWLLRSTILLGLFYVLLPTSVHSANVLFIALSPSISHQKAYQPVWKELSLRGHNVHTVTTNPLKDPTLTNLTEYDLGFLYDILKNIPAEDKKFVFKKPSFLTVFVKDIFMTWVFSWWNELMFEHEEMQRLLTSDLNFDVVIAEWLFPTMGAFAAKYKCPLIGISSLGVPLVTLDAIGNPAHPIATPDHNLPVTRAMPFIDRLLSSLYSVYVRVWHRLVVLPREDKLVKKYIGEDLPYLGDIERNVSILLLNRNHAFHRIMPVVPAIIELGSVSLNRTKPKMSSDIQKFMDNSKQGVIYFSLGSNMLATYLPTETLNLFLEVFRQLPYNVLFKWENDTLPGKPDNVFISKWLPQLTILDHPNTKLFITQGGLQSAEETIITHVPIIGLPTHADQTTNVDTFATYGAGIGLDLSTVTFEQLNSSIYQIMENPSYKENMKNLADIMYDHPDDGLQRAIWWIEYVIRHKGAKHLRSPILDIPWWQYFMIDVITFCISILALVGLTIYLFVKGLYLLLKKIVGLVFSRNKAIKRKQQ